MILETPPFYSSLNIISIAVPISSVDALMLSVSLKPNFCWFYSCIRYASCDGDVVPLLFQLFFVAFRKKITDHCRVCVCVYLFNSFHSYERVCCDDPTVQSPAPLLIVVSSQYLVAFRLFQAYFFLFCYCASYANLVGSFDFPHRWFV